MTVRPRAWPRTFARAALSLSVSLVLVAALTGCGGDNVHQPLSVRGAQLARDPHVSRSQYNAFACTTCHAEHPADVGTRILSGAVLESVANRSTWWGGETESLREAVLRCWTTFMRGVPEDLDGPTGEALYAWLTALSSPVTDAGRVPVAATYPRSIQDIPPGDATRGGLSYHRACSVCHGEPNAGPVLGLSSLIPADTIGTHDVPGMCAPGTCGSFVRQIIIEKIRHGSFLGYTGNMAPFSTEALPDGSIADILAYMHLPDN